MAIDSTQHKKSKAVLNCDWFLKQEKSTSWTIKRK